MGKRLWDKGAELNAQVLHFTVSEEDLAAEREIVRADVIGSAAQCRMLEKIGLLTSDDAKGILAGLREILALDEAGNFPITRELEDCHTAIEMFLTQRLGEAGKRIHAGRSRNDQVILAMRLYLRDAAVQLSGLLLVGSETLVRRARELSSVPMPGFTHMQPAMPSSVGLWLHGFAESLLTHARDGEALLAALDANPLGASAGFGCPLPLDRAEVAKLLGFSRVQRNPIDIQNSRGRSELRLVRWCSDIALTLEKFAWDLILYSASNTGFFGIPESFTTGSSIMPQKRNPDVLELLRARASVVRSCAMELEGLIAKMPSNYHRDFQYTKFPAVRAKQIVEESLRVFELVVGALTVNRDALSQAMSVELYATYDAFREVKAGKPFREAYRLTADRLKAGALKAEELAPDFDPIHATLLRELDEAEKECAALKKSADAAHARIESAARAVLGL